MMVHHARVLLLAAVLVGGGAAAADTHGPVTATDTLWSLAERFRPDETVSVQRMMLALLEANPEAFSTQNVNALQVGAVLRIPTREEIGPEAKAEALAEVRRQHAAWDAYGASLVRQVAPAPERPAVRDAEMAAAVTPEAVAPALGSAPAVAAPPPTPASVLDTLPEPLPLNPALIIGPLGVALVIVGGVALGRRRRTALRGRQASRAGRRRRHDPGSVTEMPAPTIPDLDRIDPVLGSGVPAAWKPDDGHKARRDGGPEPDSNDDLDLSVALGPVEASAESVRRLPSATDQGHADAQSNLGVTHDAGRGVPQNHAEAVRWYRRAADQGHATTQDALEVMDAAGQCVPQDDAEAVRWWRLAADRGDAFAQLRFAWLVAEGEGVQQDFAEAVRWWRRAAVQGHPLGQFSLGTAYWAGVDMPQDLVSAYLWVCLAADSDSDEREMFIAGRSSLAALLTADQIADTQRRAREWTPTPSRIGYRPAGVRYQDAGVEHVPTCS